MPKLGCVALAATLVAAMPTCAAHAAAAASNPYVQAARAARVPLNLLVAIAGTESAYHPWALNLGGREIYCHSRQEAERMAAAAGDNVDLGLMQINYRMWGKRFKLTKSQLLDPLTNLRVGAQILRRCLAGPGSLWRRIGRYHSPSPDKEEHYDQVVYDRYLRYLRGEPP